MSLLRHLHAGRFSPSQTARFGAAVGSVAYLAVGRVALLVSLPVRWQKADPVLPLFDLNAHLRAHYEAQGRPHQEWLQPSED